MVNEREIILDALLEILENGEFSDRVTNAVLSKYAYLDRHTKNLILRECEGTVERLIELDYLISRESKVKIGKMKPLIRTALRMGTYEIHYMDSIGEHATVNEIVKLVKKRGMYGLSGFVNGVLRSVARNKDNVSGIPEHVRLSVPEEIYKMWTAEYGAEKTKEICEAFLSQDGFFVRANETVVGEEELLRDFRECGAEVSVTEIENIFGKTLHAIYVKGLSDPASHPLFIKGGFYIQDLGSMAVALAADIKEGLEVVDVCAAPGGKATHVAQLMGGTGHVLARDLTEDKVSLIEENIDRLGLSNIDTQVWDATVTDENLTEKCDRVICDLPCSGLGVIGKKPEIKYNCDLTKIKNLAELQYNILKASCGYVKHGGRLVYSTCTITKEENDGNTDRFLAENPEFTEVGRLQLFPDKTLHNDGFYIAVLERK